MSPEFLTGDMRPWRILLLFLMITGGSLRAQYIVESGDTLSGIAKKALGDGGRWREIAHLNGLSEPYRLRVGQQLRIPGRSAAKHRVDQTSAPAEISQPVLAQEIVPGDSWIAGIIRNLFGEDSNVATWLGLWPLLIPILFCGLMFLAFIVFWSTGVMFSMYLFKHELSRRKAIYTALSCFGILTLASVPIWLLDLKDQNIEQRIPWAGGVLAISLLLCVRVTKKITGCPWWQSPIVFFFSQVFGMATAISLTYVAMFLIFGLIAAFF